MTTHLSFEWIIIRSLILYSTWEARTRYGYKYRYDTATQTPPQNKVSVLPSIDLIINLISGTHYYVREEITMFSSEH